jgi:glycogen debranching enzyme
MFTGWGVRTLSRAAGRYNPVSYHNGSVWPHDTAIVAAGLARYGFTDHAQRIAEGLLEAAEQFDGRLPELFCGFTRAPSEAPIAYPVACLPQAWSSGSVFMTMQSCLGLEIDGVHGEIQVTRPRLPIGIDHLTIRRLSVGSNQVDLSFQRVGDRVVAYLDTRHEGLAPLVVRT